LEQFFPILSVPTVEKETYNTEPWNEARNMSQDLSSLQSSQDFHCYLLRSKNPQHPCKSYVGFTVNPARRLRQHNGILKHGGAWKTKRAGRPWEFTVIVHGFPTQKMALQFEWAWQHCNKSLAVRAAIGDEEGRKLKRKRGIPGQLYILKTLLFLVPDLYAKQKLTIYFFDNPTKEVYDKIPVNNHQDLSHISNTIVESIEYMPFWPSRNKKRPIKKKKQITTTTNTDASMPTSENKSRCCLYCHQAVGDQERTVKCRKCHSVMHDICGEIYIDEGNSKCKACRELLNVNQHDDNDDDLIIFQPDSQEKKRNKNSITDRYYVWISDNSSDKSDDSRGCVIHDKENSNPAPTLCLDRDIRYDSDSGVEKSIDKRRGLLLSLSSKESRIDSYSNTNELMPNRFDSPKTDSQNDHLAVDISTDILSNSPEKTAFILSPLNIQRFNAMSLTSSSPASVFKVDRNHFLPKLPSDEKSVISISSDDISSSALSPLKYPSTTRIEVVDLCSP
jgi:predicted GIY-YIG superfamily endonuclease